MAYLLFAIYFKWARKVGETVKTEDKTLQEAERIGLNLKDRKRHGRRGYGHRSVVK